MTGDVQVPFFPHRLNRDGSYDSICLRCLSTIANAKTSAELDAYDLKHDCGEFPLRKQGLFGRFL
jgi:hypothetical protein